GMETVPLRMRAHCENAQKVAEWLSGQSGVSKVIYPSLMDAPMKARAEAVLNVGYGALLGFELAGGAEAGQRFIDALQMLYHVANIGDARSLAIHPASTTHSQLSAEDQLASGVTPGYVRLSIGIEHIDDILADLGQALKAV
ncbi:MAG: PLP-dependent transferase, partial [Pseudomonadota bacterium]|nr:PLP-dependent transferase [Pseudomonadota bacterium]